VIYELASRPSKPSFTTRLIHIAFSDAQNLNDIFNMLSTDDTALWSVEDQEILANIKASLNRIVSWGPFFFLLFLGEFADAATQFVAISTRTACNGFFFKSSRKRVDPFLLIACGFYYDKRELTGRGPESKAPQTEIKNIINFYIILQKTAEVIWWVITETSSTL